MTAKEYLGQAFYLDRKIRAKERQLESLRAHAVYTTPQFGDDSHTSVTLKSSLEEAVVKIVELEEYISEQIMNLVHLKQEICQAIKAINNPEYETLLEMRYLSFMKWDEISASLNYSRRYMFTVHGRALELVKIESVH